MLFIGERVGTKKGQALDIAVDPLEGTNFVANNLPNAFSVVAVSEKNNLFFAPDTYMEKIAIGANLPKNLLDLDNSIEKNISLLANAKQTTPDKLTVCILERPRHEQTINSLKKMNVNLKLISDGDVSGVIYTVDNNSPVDMYVGIGGGPEGILAASALDANKCFFQGRLLFDNENNIKRAKEMGIKDLKKKYNINELVTGDSIFTATGITDGDLLNGIKIDGKIYISETLVTHKRSGTFEIIKIENEIL